MGKFGQGGSRPKITEEQINIIETAIRMGCYVETACAYGGIHKSSFYRMLKEGQKRPKSIFGKFKEKMEKALAESEMRDLSVIDSAANGLKGYKRDWKAAAWKLERRYPRRWSQKSVLIETDPTDAAFQDNQIQAHIDKMLLDQEAQVNQFIQSEEEE